MRSTSLFLGLLFVAALTGGVVYVNYQRTILTRDFEDQLASQKSAAPATPASPAPAAAKPAGGADDPGVLKKKIAFFEDQMRLLKQENEGLAKAVEKLNRDLKARAETPSATPPNGPMDALIRTVEDLRELKFKRVPKIVRVPADEIEKRIHAQVEEMVPASEAGIRERAAKAMGLTTDPFNYIDSIAGLTLEQAGGYYDAGKNEMLVDQDADLTARSDLKGRLVKELAVVLLAQNFDLTKMPEFHAANDDVALASRAVILGDATITKIHYGVADSLNNDASRAQPSVAAVKFTAAPVYLRDEFLFPYSQGGSFSQDLQQDDGAKALDAALARPPRSTAEILHPDLYKKSPPFQPIAIDLGDTKVAGTAPYFDNILGEFGVYVLLKRLLPEDESFNAATGWLGDRYLCFPGDEKNGDHVFWKTLWQSEKDAAEFAKAIQSSLLHRYAIPWNKRYEQSDGSFSVDDPYRIMRVRTTADKKSVTVIDATNSAFADAIEKSLGQK